jgi:hypothetical protein
MRTTPKSSESSLAKKNIYQYKRTWGTYKNIERKISEKCQTYSKLLSGTPLK